MKFGSRKNLARVRKVLWVGEGVADCEQHKGKLWDDLNIQHLDLDVADRIGHQTRIPKTYAL